jgi:hypothetical protein
VINHKFLGQNLNIRGNLSHKEELTPPNSPTNVNDANIKKNVS